jgi:hypothetical protein
MTPVRAAALLGVAFWIGAAPSSRATFRQSPDPRRVVNARSTVTYLDLLKHLFPDAVYEVAKTDVRAHRSVPIRNVDAAQDPTELESDIAITSLDPRWVNSGGRSLLLLTIDVSAEDANEATPFEGETTFVAAFEIGASSRLVDALEVQTDRFAELWEQQPVLHLTASDDAFVVHNTHWNAGESYDAFTLLFLDHGKFAVISDLQLLSTQGCGTSYTETPAYSALPRAGRAFPDITVRVTLTKAADGNECDRRTPGFTRGYTATYAWNVNKRQYVGDLRGFAALDRFNRGRLP